MAINRLATKRVISSILIALCLMFELSAFASLCNAPRNFLRCLPQCRPTDYYFRDGMLVLTNKSAPDHQRFFVIRNFSGQTVYLDHLSQGITASAGWGTRLDPFHIAGFALMHSQMPFVCSVRRPMRYGDSYDCIPCQQVLCVCAIPNAKYVVGTEGTYWAAENYEHMGRFMRKISGRGIAIPPAPVPAVRPPSCCNDNVITDPCRPCMNGLAVPDQHRPHHHRHTNDHLHHR